MRNDRRIFLTGWLALAASPLLLSGQQNPSTPNSGNPRNPPGAIPSTEPNEFPNDASGRNPAPEPATPNPRVVLEQDRKELQRDSTELALMAQDLKKQVDSLDTTQVLSLDLIHKAEAIEKLAHQIKTLMQGR